MNISFQVYKILWGGDTTSRRGRRRWRRMSWTCIIFQTTFQTLLYCRSKNDVMFCTQTILWMKLPICISNKCFATKTLLIWTLCQSEFWIIWAFFQVILMRWVFRSWEWHETSLTEIFHDLLCFQIDLMLHGNLFSLIW